MGDTVVYAQLYNLGIHHDKFNVIGVCFINDTHNQSIDADGFTGARSACDQQMRHLCNVRHHNLAADVLSHRKSQTGFMAAEGL